MLQGKIAVLIVMFFGLVLIIGAIANWKVLMDNGKMEFINKKWGASGSRVVIGLIGLLLLLAGIYMHQTKKLEQTPVPEELIFQF